MIGSTSVHSGFEKWEAIVVKVEEIVAEIYKQPDIEKRDVVVTGETQAWGGQYKTVPFWRCQPYFRVGNGEKQNTRKLQVAASSENGVKSEEKNTKTEETEVVKKVEPEEKEQAEEKRKSTPETESELKRARVV